MSRTPKWIRRQLRRPWRDTKAQRRDLRFLWRHRANRNVAAEVFMGRIIWSPEPGERF